MYERKHALRPRRKRLRGELGDTMHGAGGGEGCGALWGKPPWSHCASLRAKAAISFRARTGGKPTGGKPAWAKRRLGRMMLQLPMHT